MPLNPPLTLRPATSADWPAVAALLQAHGLPLAGAREHLPTFLLAVSQGEVVGCAGAEVHGDVALLRSVAVAPGLQWQGIGRQLVTQMLHEAGRRSLRSVHLLTTTAAPWFERLGFRAEPVEQAPTALRASAELRGACPASATFMSLAWAVPVAPSADLPVAVIGAGPVGLAAAARLLERGLAPLVLEAGPQVGAHLADYGHVRLFSPWRYNIDTAMAAQLAAQGWQAPPADELPLAGDVVQRLLQPYAELPTVAPTLRLGTRVTAISREGFDKVRTRGRETAAFVIHAVQHGRPVAFKARAVIDASGTWSTPNPLGASGLPADGEQALGDTIAYGIPDVLGTARARYAGRRVLVVGAGHSAANALLALAELAEADTATQLVWATRSATLTRVLGGGSADALPARGALGSALKDLRDSGRLQAVTGLHITAVQRDGAAWAVVGHGPDHQPMQINGIDRIICATGQRPDLSLASELRLALDPALESTVALAPLIDPNMHSCGTVRPHGHRELSHPEPGFYTVGVKSYGRAPTFLMATGYEQARSVVAALAGDLEAADRVELDLPETGVCSLGDGGSVEVAPMAAGNRCCAAEPAPVLIQRRATQGCGPTACAAPAPAPRCCG